MSKFLDEYNGYNSELYMVFPLLKNETGFKCKLKFLKKRNYKIYNENHEKWYNLNSRKKLNYIIGGSKGIKIHYLWLSDEILKPTTGFIYRENSCNFDKIIDDYNEKFETDYKKEEVVVIMLYLSNKFMWDEEKILSFLDELEEDYFSIQDETPPCSDCRYLFMKNLTKKCNYLYVEAKFTM